MQNDWKSNPFIKALAVILSILFLWGTGLSMLIVLLDMRMGFSENEQEFNNRFLNQVLDDRMDELHSYTQFYAHMQNNRVDEGEMENTLYYFNTLFEPDRTNFRFTVTDMDGNLLLTNEKEGESKEKLAENVTIDAVDTKERKYVQQVHFSSMSELADAVEYDGMAGYLDDPSDFQLWYFSDDTLDKLYHEGVEVVEYTEQHNEVLTFDSLEELADADLGGMFSTDLTTWSVVIPEADSGSDLLAYLPLNSSIYVNGINTDLERTIKDTIGWPRSQPLDSDQIWVMAHITDEHYEYTTDFVEYLRLAEQGVDIHLLNSELDTQILENGIDITVSAAHIETENICIRSYLPAGLPIADHIRSDYEIFRLVYRYSEGIVLAMFGFLVLTVVSCILMCSTAGHKRGFPGIHISSIDKIPYEFFWLLPIAAFIGSAFAISLMTEGSLPYRIIAVFCIGLILSISACSVLWLHTTAVRMKSETFWSSFGGVRLLRMFIGLMRHRLLASLAVAVYSAFLLAVNIGMARVGGPFLALAGIMDILTLGGVLYCIYAYSELRKHVQRMEQGDFSPIEERALPLTADFEKFDIALGGITSHVGEMVARQTRAEHLRTELITNVSHDLKTPLTSIVNYVDLLSREPMQTDSAAEYLDVLRRQAARLKKLTIDLVDASKASTGNLTVELQPTNLQVLVGQIAAEYEDQLAGKQLAMLMDVPEEPLYILADGRQIWRVFDNLLGNACKYALAGTRVYLDVFRQGDTVRITVKNISSVPLNVSPDDLMERFVRGDASRHTEGSGLGLSIARDLTRLQNGTLTLQTDGDLFKAILEFPLYDVPPEPAQPELSGMGIPAENPQVIDIPLNGGDLPKM